MSHHKKNKKKAEKKQKDNKFLKVFDLYFLPVLLIIALPFVHSHKTMDLNAAPRILFLSLTIIVFSGINLFKNNKKNCTYNFLRLSIFPVAILYIIWTVFTLIFSVNPGEGSFDIAKSLMTFALFIYLTQYFLTQNKALDIVVKSVIISAVITTATGIFQYITKIHGNTEYDIYMSLYAVKGLMAHKNQFAISLLLMLPFVTYGLFTLKRYWKMAAAYAVLMILINIIIIQTRSVWIAIIVFSFVFSILSLIFLTNNNLKSIIIKKRKIFIIAIFSLIIISISTVVILKSSGTFALIKKQASSTFSTKSTNAMWRLKMWNASWQLAKDNMLLGVGAGNWKNAVIPYYHLNFGSKYQNWRRPHNDFLWVLTEKGLFGLLLFLTIFGLILYYGFKILFTEPDKNKRLLTLIIISGITAYIIASAFTFPLERINHQVYLTIMMAIIISIYYKPSSEKVKNFFTTINIIILFFSILSTAYSSQLLRSEIYIKKALHAVNARNYHKVIRYTTIAYSPFTNVNDNNVPILMYRGMAYMKLGQLQKCYHDLKSALEIFPNHISVLNNLAIVSSELNKKQEPVKYLEKSLYLFPHYEESLSNLVIVHYRNKEYKKAYTALLNQDTRKPNAQYKKFKKLLEQLINKKNSN